MKKQLQLNDGSILISGSVFMIVPMISHPHSKATEAILKEPTIIFSINVFTHSIAILSIPLLLFGFWRLTRFFKNEIASIAFITICLGMFSVMCAATLDGFVTSSFINRIRSTAPETNQMKLILTYNSSMVQSFSLVYAFAVCIAIILWSILMITHRMLPKWLGYYGLGAASLALLAMLNGIVLMDFIGIKIFVLGFASWTLLLGLLLKRNGLRDKK